MFSGEKPGRVVLCWCSISFFRPVSLAVGGERGDLFLALSGNIIFHSSSALPSVSLDNVDEDEQQRQLVVQKLWGIE